jgi:glutathione S-transferase
VSIVQDRIMHQHNPIIILGVPASPYTRKMLAYLRYRNVPYQCVFGDARSYLLKYELEIPKPLLLPVIIMDDEYGMREVICDSSPIIRRLENSFPQREALPRNKVLALLISLLEDYGDEWVTKYMFHYRWHYAPDIKNAASLLPLYSNMLGSDKEIKATGEFFSKIQIERLWVVGSSESTANIIKESFERFIIILSSMLTKHRFLLGSRPSSADFAFFGQLTQLTQFDPTSRSFVEEKHPRVRAWVDLMEDLSGYEIEQQEWLSTDDSKVHLQDFLSEIGKTYVPTMLANEEAIIDNKDSWETKVLGKTWMQKSFPYQKKCLQWLRDEFNALSKAEQDDFLNILAGTNCEQIFT